MRQPYSGCIEARSLRRDSRGTRRTSSSGVSARRLVAEPQHLGKGLGILMFLAFVVVAGSNPVPLDERAEVSLGFGCKRRRAAGSSAGRGNHDAGFGILLPMLGQRQAGDKGALQRRRYASARGGFFWDCIDSRGILGGVPDHGPCCMSL